MIHWYVYARIADGILFTVPSNSCTIIGIATHICSSVVCALDPSQWNRTYLLVICTISHSEGNPLGGTVNRIALPSCAADEALFWGALERGCA